jgi:hypothetical protein
MLLFFICTLQCFLVFILFIFLRVLFVSYEVLMLTSKCEVCGLPDRGGQPGHGQFPCGHFASQRRRASAMSVSSGFYIPPSSESPVPSPIPNFLGVVGPTSAASAYSPIKDSSKSLLSSLCRYQSVRDVLFSISGTFTGTVFYFVFSRNKSHFVSFQFSFCVHVFAFVSSC